MNFNSRLTKLIVTLTLTLISSLSVAESDQKIVIFAAASLTNAIDEIAENYEKESKMKNSNFFCVFIYTGQTN